MWREGLRCGGGRIGLWPPSVAEGGANLWRDVLASARSRRGRIGASPVGPGRRAAIGGALAVLAAPAVRAQTPFAGTILHVSLPSIDYYRMLRQYVPEFERSSGIRTVFDLQTPAVYAERANLE